MHRIMSFTVLNCYVEFEPHSIESLDRTIGLFHMIKVAKEAAELMNSHCNDEDICY
jgi:hypothetical protein